jgi:ankyrin repeat protein
VSLILHWTIIDFLLPLIISTNSAKHLAASRGHYECAKLLLNERVEIDTAGPDNRTALRLSADNGDLDFMELLLNHGARVNARDKFHSTALHSAARNGEHDVAKLLLSHGADFEAKDAELMSAIHHCCSGTGNHEGREAILSSFMSRKGKTSVLESPGQKGMSALCYGAASGKYICIA